ncbi:MAG TPA: toxin TcdB middle/N-terminal domain-containing protein [Bdellovibrionota bacterium]|nr:toxin TcdB middle/N-terminal domain-containing protein [Bdellovibrionota bacterium]
MGEKRNNVRAFLSLFLACLMAFPFSLLPVLEARAEDEFDAGGNLTGDARNVSPSPKPAKGKSQGGSFSNLFAGAATYSIPIGVLPGIQGMSPSLGLTYSSDGPIKSWVGQRWSFGVPAMDRRGVDKTVTKFDSTDLFLLGGTELKRTTDANHYSYANPDQFTTADEGFSKIIKNETNNRWTVTSANGTKSEFSTPILRVDSDPAKTPFQNTRVWALTRVTNVAGYFMEFFYDIDTDGGDFYLQRIEYTKGPAGFDTGRLIEFELDSRGTDSTSVSYASGSKVVIDQRLKTIRVWADRAKTQLFASYDLIYNNNVPDASNWISSESLLTRVEGYGPTGALASRWVLEYNARTPGWTKVDASLPYVFADVQQLCADGTPLGLNQGVRFVQVNKDGLPDLVQARSIMADPSPPPQRSLKINTGSDGSGPTTWGSLLAGPAEDFVTQNCISMESRGVKDLGYTAVDLDGDGDQDLYQGFTTREVWINNNGTWERRTDWEINLPTWAYLVGGSPQRSMDVSFGNLNGDRCPDLIRGFYWDTSVYPAILRPPRYAINPCESGRAWTSGELPLVYNGYSLSNFRTADLNGDGLTDLIYLRSVDNSRNPGPPFVWLNRGNNNFEYDLSLSTLLTSAATSARFLDVNADGFDDFVSGSSLFINRQGSSFQSVSSAGLDDTVVIADVKGTGLLAYARSKKMADGSMDPLNGIYVANGSYPGLLSKVKPPTGGSIAFSYTPSTQMKKSDNVTSANPDLPMVKQLLTSVSLDDGYGVSYTTKYQYDGGYFDGADREFRGFRKVTVEAPKRPTDSQGIKSVTYYHQKPPLVGTVDYSETYGSDGNLYARSHAIYTTNLSVSDLPDPVDPVDSVPDCSMDPLPTNLDCSIPYFNPVRRSESTIFAGTARDDSSQPSFTARGDQEYVLLPDGHGLIDQVISRPKGEPGFTPLSRLTVSKTELKSNQTDWLLHLPKRTLLFAADDETVALVESRVIYDGNGDGLFNGEGWNDDLPLLPNVPLPVRSEAVGNFNGYNNSNAPMISETAYDTVYKTPNSSKDTFGHTTRIEYDANHMYPIRVTNALGHQASVTYDDFGRVETSTDPNGIVSQVYYDGLHRPWRSTVSVNDVIQGESKTEYHGFCDEVCITAADTDTVTDPKGINNPQVAQRVRSKSSQYPRQSEVNWPWSESYVDALGRAWKSRAKSNNLGDIVTATVEFELGTGRPYRASPAHREGGAVPADNLWSETVYDAIGRAVAAKFPSSTGQVLQSSVSYFLDTTLHALKTVSIDPMHTSGSLHTKESFTNLLGQLIQVTEYVPEVSPVAHSMQYDYDVLGNLIQVRDDQGPEILATFNAFGQKVETLDPDMGTWTYEYDAEGKLTGQWDAMGNGVTLVYDALHRVIEKDYNSPNQVQSISSYTYDRNPLNSHRNIGALMIEQNENARSEYTYDALGRPTLTEKWIGQDKVETGLIYYDDRPKTQVVYDAGSASPEIITYLSEERTGRFQEMSSDQPGVNIFAENPVYDVLGKLKSVDYGDGLTGHFSYMDGTEGHEDGNQSLSRMWLLPTGAADLYAKSNLLDFHYVYDNNGNISNLLDDAGGFDKRYTNDALGRLTRAEIVQTTNGLSEVRNYGYDRMGRMTSMDGRYQPFGKEYAPPAPVITTPTPTPTSTVTPTPTPTPTPTATPAPPSGGKKKQASIPSRSLYNLASLLLDALLPSAEAARTLSGDTSPPEKPTLSVVQGEVGKVKLTFSSTDNVGVSKFWIYKSTSPFPIQVTISPPATSVTASYVDPAVSPGATYSYYVVARDDALNSSLKSDTISITTLKPITMSYVGPGPVHAPKNDGFYRYEYDLNGNLTHVYDTRTAPETLVEHLEYTVFNKLAGTTDAFGNKVEYRYDANLERVAKITKDSYGNVVDTEKYFGNIEMKNGVKAKRYYFLGSQRLAERNMDTGLLTFLHQDHLGSTALVTDENGSILPGGKKDYYEFGAQIPASSGGSNNDYLYNDMKLDKATNLSATDLYDYHARSYAAKRFTFAQPDTIIPDPTDPQSYNRYAYVNNNPINMVDPTGHWGGYVSACYYTCGGGGGGGGWSGNYDWRSDPSYRGGGLSLSGGNNGNSAIEAAYQGMMAENRAQISQHAQNLARANSIISSDPIFGGSRFGGFGGGGFGGSGAGDVDPRESDFSYPGNPPGMDPSFVVFPFFDQAVQNLSEAAGLTAGLLTGNDGIAMAVTFGLGLAAPGPKIPKIPHDQAFRIVQEIFENNTALQVLNKILTKHLDKFNEADAMNKIQDLSATSLRNGGPRIDIVPDHIDVPGLDHLGPERSVNRNYGSFDEANNVIYLRGGVSPGRLFREAAHELGAAVLAREFGGKAFIPRAFTGVHDMFGQHMTHMLDALANP